VRGIRSRRRGEEKRERAKEAGKRLRVTIGSPMIGPERKRL